MIFRNQLKEVIQVKVLEAVSAGDEVKDSAKRMIMEEQGILEPDIKYLSQIF